MAKQRRTPPLAKSQSDSGSTHDTPQPAGREHRPSYFEAVAVYERGVHAIQRHDFPEARALLESVLSQFPEEKELHERVRLYLNVCARQEASQSAEPQSIDERLYAATIAINEGNYDRAIKQLHLVRDEDSDNDRAIYMLGVAHAQRGDLIAAIAHLERAIVLNPENRAHARHDPDLEPIRDDEAFRAAIDGVQDPTDTGEPDDRRRLGHPRPPR
jgi:tetratricopeptide (TPR) repeat protein